MIHKIIIAGGRDMNDCLFAFPKIDRVTSRLHRNNIEVVCGAAKGADTVGELWAKKNNIPIKYFRADWSKGRNQGHVRNKEMAEYATHLIAFWDNESRGTENMINVGKFMDLKTKVIPYRCEIYFEKSSPLPKSRIIEYKTNSDIYLNI